MNTKPHQNLLTLASASCLALLLLLTASACGSDDSNEANTPQTAGDPITTGEPTTTTLSTQDEVEQAYLEFVEMITRVSTTTVDPNDAELAQRMVDPALGTLRTQLSTWQAQGQVWLEGDHSRHQVETVSVGSDGLTAVVTDCVVENDVLVGVGVADAPFPSPRTARVTTSMINQEGAWMVQESDEVNHWQGVAGCAA
jgi:hypothetical protein